LIVFVEVPVKDGFFFGIARYFIKDLLCGDGDFLLDVEW
jgi:hypothetical protein